MDVYRVVFWGHNEATSANSARLESPEKPLKLEIRNPCCSQVEPLDGLSHPWKLKQQFGRKFPFAYMMSLSRGQQLLRTTGSVQSEEVRWLM
jgi:hypothetical protein